MSSARQRAAPGPTGTRGRDRGTTRHAGAAPLRLGSTGGRGVRCPRGRERIPSTPAARARRPAARPERGSRYHDSPGGTLAVRLAVAADHRGFPHKAPLVAALEHDGHRPGGLPRLRARGRRGDPRGARRPRRARLRERRGRLDRGEQAARHPRRALPRPLHRAPVARGRRRQRAVPRGARGRRRPRHRADPRVRRRALLARRAPRAAPGEGPRARGAGALMAGRDEPFSLVIFGASGDLTRRKLMPALWSLYAGRTLPEPFAIVSTARTGMSDDEFRRRSRAGIDEFARIKPPSEQVWDRFASALTYVAGDPADPGLYAKLEATLTRIESARPGPANRLYYCATPPSLYDDIIMNLG